MAVGKWESRRRWGISKRETWFRFSTERLFHSLPASRVLLLLRDNAIQLGDRWLQTELTDWRGTLAGCRVMVH